MAKKHRRHKMATWRKWARAGAGVAGALIGGLVAFSPFSKRLGDLAKDPVNAVNGIVYDTTGINPSSGQITPDFGKIAGTAVVVGVGIGLMYLIRSFARRI